MKKFHLLISVFILVALLFSQETSAQSTPSLQDISQLKVDELSDDQIRKFIDRVEASGYTEDQLVIMAQARGMSQSEIQKLRRRIEQIKNSPTRNQSSNGSGISRLRSSEEIKKESDRSEFAYDPFETIVKDSTETGELRIFGLDFFKKTDLSFETGLNMPTPTNYIVGAGDEIIIDIWGASEQTYQLVVSPEGSIRIPSLGPIYISGLTIQKAKEKVISRLKRIYSTIGRSSYADVTLGQIRSINVHVIGAVEKPGTYTLSSFGTVFNALYSAGGPSRKGSLRNVEVFRNRKLISNLDAYAFLIRGTGENITLQEGDVIIVRAYKNRVVFDGEVKNPAIYELLDGETLDDLMLYSGGYTENSYRGTINLRRIEKNFKTIKSIPGDSINQSVLKSGDEIFVSKISGEFKGRVTIEGPVLNPGEYQFSEGLKLSKLLDLADGFKGDIFLSRAVIVRQNEDFSLSSLSFDPQKVLNGEEDIELSDNDIIRFQSIYDLREEYSLRIEGQVSTPGKYAFVDNMTVEDLIYLAGGFKEAAARSFVEVARRLNPDSIKDANRSAEIFNFSISKDLKLNGHDSKFALMPYDLVVVRKSPFYQEQEMIEIEGEVQFPGKYALQNKEERISSVLKRAGGLSPFAFANGATLIRRTEYFREQGNDEESLNDAARIRKEDLTNIFAKDTLFENEKQIFRQQEFIGINLQEIIDHPGSEHDMIMREGDILSVPREFQTVRVRGEVLYPSNMRFDQGSGLKKYVAQAGGFDQTAKKSKAYVIYANGASSQTSSFLFFKNYPKIEPGAEVVIPKKPERQPLSVQAWIALSTSIATLALVVQQIAN